MTEDIIDLNVQRWPEHTPVLPLLDSKNLIGWVCLHCMGVFTPSMQPSELIRFRGPFPTINKTHLARMRAMKRVTKQYKRGRYDGRPKRG
jgi:hypothetical protein